MGLRANYLQPKIYDKIAATDTKCKCSVFSFSLHYIRPTHMSAQSFRPCVYNQFDTRNPWLETRASLSNCAIFTVGGATSSTFLSKLYRKSHDISSLHVNHRELLVKLTINTLEMRSVVSQWWSVRPHGRYHLGSDDH